MDKFSDFKTIMQMTDAMMTLTTNLYKAKHNGMSTSMQHYSQDALYYHIPSPTKYHVQAH